MARLSWATIALAAVSFALSWTGLPATAVESLFAGTIFPWIARGASATFGLVPFSVVDLIGAGALVVLVVAVARRRFLHAAALAAAAYLVFFWAWGVQYHRQPLSQRLGVDLRTVQQAEVEALARSAAGEINRLYSQKAGGDAARIRERVRAVVSRLDGRDWPMLAASKSSVLAEPFMRAAGVSGFFNPLGHEAIVSSGLLDIERPVVMAHELAHAYGYANEGEANFIAVVSTLTSDDPAIRYCGWLFLWLYVRDRDLDGLLDEGPRRDLLAIFGRIRSQTVEWLSSAQTKVLDVFLRANRVPGGVRSYSQVVLLTVATFDRLSEFRN